MNAALSGLKELLGETPVDPLPGKLRELAGQGRVGAVVTKLDLSPDLASVAVRDIALGPIRRSMEPGLRPDRPPSPRRPPGQRGEGLADDPQVKAAFGMIESLGLGEVPPEMKQRSLNMGAATRKALGQARGALDQELNSAALSLEPPRDPSPSTNPTAKP